MAAFTAVYSAVYYAASTCKRMLADADAAVIIPALSTYRMGRPQPLDDGSLRGLVRFGDEVDAALHLQPRIFPGLDGRRNNPDRTRSVVREGVNSICVIFHQYKKLKHPYR